MCLQLQKNHIMSLPDSFADLDLSHNALTSLPHHIYSLPALSLLDISHNAFTALPFNMPFDPATSAPTPSRRSNSLAPEIVRATCPLPSLTSLDASHNNIVSLAIHRNVLPQNIRTFDLAYNPLSDIAELLTSLSAFTQLVNLRMSRYNIDNTSFPSSLLTSVNKSTFPKSTVLDLEQVRVTQTTVSKAPNLVIELGKTKNHHDKLQRAFRDCQLALRDLNQIPQALPPSSSSSSLPISTLQTILARLEDFNEDACVMLKIRIVDEERIACGYTTLHTVPGAIACEVEVQEVE